MYAVRFEPFPVGDVKEMEEKRDEPVCGERSDDCKERI
jgi:hypothetical protein